MWFLDKFRIFRKSADKRAAPATVRDLSEKQPDPMQFYMRPGWINH